MTGNTFYTRKDFEDAVAKVAGAYLATMGADKMAHQFVGDVRDYLIRCALEAGPAITRNASGEWDIVEVA